MTEEYTTKEYADQNRLCSLQCPFVDVILKGQHAGLPDEKRCYLRTKKGKGDEVRFRRMNPQDRLDKCRELAQK